MKRGLSLIQGLLVGAGVDLKELLALLHFLAFLEEYLLELTADLRLDGDHRDRLNGTDLAHLNGDVPSLRLRDRDRRGWYNTFRFVGLIVAARAAKKAHQQHGRKPAAEVNQHL